MASGHHGRALLAIGNLRRTVRASRGLAGKSAGLPAKRQRRFIHQPKVGATQERLPWVHRKIAPTPTGLHPTGRDGMQPLQR